MYKRVWQIIKKLKKTFVWILPVSGDWIKQLTQPEITQCFIVFQKKNTNCNPFLSSYSIGLSGQKHLLGAVLKNTFIVTLVKLEQKFKKKSVATVERNCKDFINIKNLIKCKYNEDKIVLHNKLFFRVFSLIA